MKRKTSGPSLAVVVLAINSKTLSSSPFAWLCHFPDLMQSNAACVYCNYVQSSKRPEHHWLYVQRTPGENGIKIEYDGCFLTRSVLVMETEV